MRAEKTTERVAAVVVTYHPDEGVPARLAEIAAQCWPVFVMDNGSGADALARLRAVPDVEVVALGENRGLGVALNLGLRRARDAGCAWAVTFDQDSTPEPGMVVALLASARAGEKEGRVAVVGPRLREERVGQEDHRWVLPHPGRSWAFRLEPCRERDLPGVAFVITSGALMRLDAFVDVGPMDEDLFIDYIDHDYCLRARARGYEIIVSAGAVLRHNLGAKREFHLAGRVVRPTFHGAFRHRYMARNRWHLWRRHARRFPHWAMFDLVFSHYNLLRVLVFENDRLAKLGAVLHGNWDGLRGRRGRIS